MTRLTPIQTSAAAADAPQARPALVRAFQWDLARQVERLDVLLRLLPKYSSWGYTELYLHLEDAVEYPSLPEVARKDAYSYRQLGRLVTAASRVGIHVVPIVNLLGHTQYLVKTPGLRDLNELRLADGSPAETGQICPTDPRTPAVAEKLIHDMAPFCTAGKVHVGLDESFHLGRCPRCRAEITRDGLGRHFARHVGRLHEIANRRGLRLGIWADMLNFIPEAIPLLPPGIAAYDWYYYPFHRHPRVEFFNFAESDLAPALRAHGIEYWGCPMNGAFRYEPLPIFGERLANLRSWWRRCAQVNAAGMLVTSWETYRLAFDMTAVVDAAAACLWLDPEITDDRRMLARGFERVFGRATATRCAQAALASDRYPFAGYAKWEINERWDVPATEAALRQARRERSAVIRLTRAPRSLPVALSASIAFRAYLAARDVFVCESAQAWFQLRRLQRANRGSSFQQLIAKAQKAAAEFQRELTRGRTACRTMWNRTRDPRAGGQNERILAADQRRLTAWQRWLSLCAKKPAHAWSQSVFGARWRLQFVVHNFAPALQRIAVEQRQSDGTWKRIKARYTIEFQAGAAQPRARIKREFSVALESADARTRVSVGGLGQVRLTKMALTDGVVEIPLPLARRAFGRPAPLRGFPDLDAADEIAIEFALPASD